MARVNVRRSRYAMLIGCVIEVDVEHEPILKVLARSPRYTGEQTTGSGGERKCRPSPWTTRRWVKDRRTRLLMVQHTEGTRMAYSMVACSGMF